MAKSNKKYTFSDYMKVYRKRFAKLDKKTKLQLTAIVVLVVLILIAAFTALFGRGKKPDSSSENSISMEISGSYDPLEDSRYEDEYLKLIKDYSDVVIPETVTYDNTTFTVTRIGYLAFCGCKNLNSVTIPNSVTSIVRQAFYCSSITSVKLGGGVKDIGDQAFFECANLTSIIIPDNVTSLGYSTFWGCSDLSSVIIGNGITEIGFNDFTKCTSLSR